METLVRHRRVPPELLFVSRSGGGTTVAGQASPGSAGRTACRPGGVRDGLGGPRRDRHLVRMGGSRPPAHALAAEARPTVQGSASDRTTVAAPVPAPSTFGVDAVSEVEQGVGVWVAPTRGLGALVALQLVA